MKQKTRTRRRLPARVQAGGTTAKQGWIVGFALRPTLPPKERVKFFRQLYGYTDKSQYGKYHYTRKGLLDNLGYVPFARGAFIIPTDALKEVKRFLKGKARFKVRRIALAPSDQKRLKPKQK